MCSQMGVVMACSQAYSHQSNGSAERAGSSVINYIRKRYAENRALAARSPVKPSIFSGTPTIKPDSLSMHNRMQSYTWPPWVTLGIWNISIATLPMIVEGMGIPLSGLGPWCLEPQAEHDGHPILLALIAVLANP